MNARRRSVSSSTRWNSPASLICAIQRSAVVGGTPEAMHSEVTETRVCSARAAVTLLHAGYAATSVCDGWLGNHTGPGLRAAETPPAAR